VIDIGRAEIGASVAGNVGIAEIIRENEDDIGWLGRRPSRHVAARGQRDHSCGGTAKQLSSSDLSRTIRNQSLVHFLVLALWRFNAGERALILRVTNLWAIPSKSRSTSGVMRDIRTNTAL
jgi:hypothetical protein